MTREAYINELRSYLGRLPLNEREAALVYYIEYFEERGDDEAASAELGSPKEAAAKIIADYEEQLGQAAPQGPGNAQAASVGCLAGVILVLSFPVWFSLLVTLLVTLLALLFAFAVVGGALFVAAFSIMSLSIPTGILSFGVSLFFLGLFLLLGCGAFWLFTRGITILWRLIINKKKVED